MIKCIDNTFYMLYIKYNKKRKKVFQVRKKGKKKMKKKVKRKYKLKESVKGFMMLLFIWILIITAMLYQAERVEEEKRQIEKEKETVLYINNK